MYFYQSDYQLEKYALRVLTAKKKHFRFVLKVKTFLLLMPQKAIYTILLQKKNTEFCIYMCSLVIWTLHWDFYYIAIMSFLRRIKVVSDRLNISRNFCFVVSLQNQISWVTEPTRSTSPENANRGCNSLIVLKYFIRI